MTRRSWWWIYPVAGLLVGVVLYFVDGQRGLTGTIAAWLLCGVPLIVWRVAAMLGIRKTSVNRSPFFVPPGMMFRLAWTLGGATILYLNARDWLGVGFWPAVLVFYQAGLAVRTRHAIDHGPT